MGSCLSSDQLDNVISGDVTQRYSGYSEAELVKIQRDKMIAQ